jgi:hypothetical protein
MQTALNAQASRFRHNHLNASSCEDSALVISATRWSLRPWVWRNPAAAGLGQGETDLFTADWCGYPAVAGRLFYLRLLLISCTRALVGVGSQKNSLKRRGPTSRKIYASFGRWSRLSWPPVFVFKPDAAYIDEMLATSKIAFSVTHPGKLTVDLSHCRSEK